MPKPNVNTFEVRKLIRQWEIVKEEEGENETLEDSRAIAERIAQEFDKLYDSKRALEENNFFDLVDAACEIFYQFPKTATAILRVADSI